MDASRATIAIIGGTGAEGGGLARRWAAAGYPVIIGSRDAARGAASAQALVDEFEAQGVSVRGTSNEEAAAAGEIVVLTVPYAAHGRTLESIREQVQGKIVVDCTVPLQPPKVMRVQLPAAGSAAQEAQALLGEGACVVSAFQNVSAHRLSDLSADPACDVLVTGNDPAARAVVVGLAGAAGMRGVEAGRLENAAAAEALTSLLIFINKAYGSPGAGIKITNVEWPEDAPEP